MSNPRTPYSKVSWRLQQQNQLFTPAPETQLKRSCAGKQRESAAMADGLGLPPGRGIIWVVGKPLQCETFRKLANLRRRAMAQKP